MKLFKTLAVAVLLLFAVPTFAQNEILHKQGTPIIFGDDAALNPVDDANNLTDDVGTDTVDCDMDLTALANDAAHQSLKCDLDNGVTANKWASTFRVMATVDFTGETPTAGSSMDYYWCPSTSSTQATGNVMGNSGANAAIPDGTVGSPTDAEFVKMCIFIGSLIVTDDATVQTGYVGTFTAPMQHGQLAVMNSSGDALEADDVENHTAFYPLIVEVQ